MGAVFIPGLPYEIESDWVDVSQTEDDEIEAKWEGSGNYQKIDGQYRKNGYGGGDSNEAIKWDTIGYGVRGVIDETIFRWMQAARGEKWDLLK